LPSKYTLAWVWTVTPSNWVVLMVWKGVKRRRKAKPRF
jgi:hypothetical protein